jgi:large subunit ribosomal protein L24
MAGINPKFLHIPKHTRDRMVGSSLSPNLREQFATRSIRVIKGDTVKVMRGEYSGIEGKVEKVNTKKGTLSIEGIQREKVRGGNVKVQIHASNVFVSTLNLDDKYRKHKIQSNNIKTPSFQDEQQGNVKVTRKRVRQRKKVKKDKTKVDGI